MNILKVLTEALKRECFRLDVPLTSENNCHKIHVYAVDEKAYGSAAANCRVSLHPPMVLTNDELLPDKEKDKDKDKDKDKQEEKKEKVYATYEMDPAKVETAKSTAVLATLGRMVRSDFFKLIPFSAAELQQAAGGGSPPYKEWKLYLATVQGPMAANSWRYDTLCDPRFKEPEGKTIDYSEAPEGASKAS